jgi:hypothetical protein
MTSSSHRFPSGFDRPQAMVFLGLGLFWLAFAGGDTPPVEALFVGPAVMILGVALMERRKRRRRNRQV